MTTRVYKAAGGEAELVWGSDKYTDTPLPDKDGRYYAIHALIDYIAGLTLQMTGKDGKTIAFTIPARNIFDEWPDNEDLADRGDEDFPRVGFETDEEEDDYPGLQASEVEGTDDVFAPNSILYMTSEHVETLEMHVLCRSKAERRAVLAGLERAFNPAQEFLGMRFRLPEYFGASCRFTLEKSGRVENQDAVRNRRELRLKLIMRVPNLFLVKLERFTPEVIVDIAPEGQDNGPTG